MGRHATEKISPMSEQLKKPEREIFLVCRGRIHAALLFSHSNNGPHVCGPYNPLGKAESYRRHSGESRNPFAGADERTAMYPSPSMRKNLDERQNSIKMDSGFRRNDGSLRLLQAEKKESRRGVELPRGGGVRGCPPALIWSPCLHSVACRNPGG